MEQFADRTPLEVVTYRSEKTRDEAKSKAAARAKELTKKTGRKHSYRHAEKLERVVYEIFAIDIEPIEAAVAPLKAQAVERAEQDTRNLIARCATDLEAAGGNLTEAAPYPERGHYGSYQHTIDRMRHNLFSRLTKSDDARDRYQSYTTSGPYYVVIDPVACEKFVEQRKREAGEQYDEFVAKLIFKVGDAKDATIDGSHVWGHSILTVTKPDGSTERWKTQQIVNTSVLGKHFNQWPTRKMK